MSDLSTIWKFVEQYYPNYSSCSDIMRNDDLWKIVNGEINGSAEIMFKNEFGSDLNEATAEYNHTSRLIYEKAIQGFIDTENNNTYAWEEIRFDGTVYQCRIITDSRHIIANLLVAPVALQNALELFYKDDQLNGTSISIDEKVCYYATPEEMELSDTDLYNLIYN